MVGLGDRGNVYHNNIFKNVTVTQSHLQVQVNSTLYTKTTGNYRTDQKGMYMFMFSPPSPPKNWSNKLFRNKYDQKGNKKGENAYSPPPPQYNITLEGGGAKKCISNFIYTPESLHCYGSPELKKMPNYSSFRTWFDPPHELQEKFEMETQKNV